MESDTSSSDSLSTRIVIAVIALVGLFYALTIQPGFPWGDDFAMYLTHANNIATGQPYSKSGYIYNRLQPEVGPPSYPPLYPAVLAPVIAVTHFNVKVIKAETTLFFLAALWFIYICLGRFIPASYAAAIVAIIGFNPFFGELKDNPVSDVPFLFLLFLTFNRVLDADQKRWKLLSQSVLIGVLLYLCFACRAAGIVLLPSLLVWEVLRNRDWPRRGLWISLGVALAGIVLQVLVLRGALSYADQIHADQIFHPAILARNLKEYAWGVRTEFLAVRGWGGSLFLMLLLLLGLAGYVLALRRGMTLVEVFSPVYLAVIFGLWTLNCEVRFLAPILPLWLLYIGIAILRLRDIGKTRIAAGVGAAVTATLAVAYISYFAGASYGPSTTGSNDPGFLSACAFVREKTAPGSVIVFSKPRLLALMTGRKSSVYPLRGLEEIVGYAREIGAEYVISGEPFANDREKLIPAVSAHPEVFQPVFRSRGFAVYRIHAGPA